AVLNDTNTANIIDYRNRVPVGVGAFWKFNDTWGANLEYSNTLFFPTEQQQNPNDFYLGARCQAEDNLVFTLGGSIGKLGGPTGQNYRVVTGVRFAPFDQAAAPSPTPMMAPLAPEPTPAATPLPTPRAVRAPPRAQEKLVITLDISSVPFEFDTARLPKYYADRIREIGRFLGTYKDTWRKLSVQGHTDERGSHQYNNRLSSERAHMVKQLLMEGGSPPAKIKSIGFGKRQPLDRHHNEKAWAKNRRVDLEFSGVKDVVLIREGIDEQKSGISVKSNLDSRKAPRVPVKSR
ncbi:MAG: OmpA family protein, partial [Bdellovibrionales bacterium]|nr:OmpA family protein [Oligoflexia bacterium]